MSSLALMRFLESAPSRYDVGMRVLTLGRVERLHDVVAQAATPRLGARVLEIGCGTGAVTARLVARGAQVTALDQNPEMLDRARLRLQNGRRVASSGRARYSPPQACQQASTWRWNSRGWKRERSSPRPSSSA